MRLFVVSLFFLCSGAVAVPEGFRVGPVIGMSFSDLALQNAGVASGTKRRVGFLGGLSADVALHERLLFQPEVFFAQHGRGSGDSYVHFDALKVPLLLKGLFPIGTAFYLGFVVGPSVEATLGGNERRSSGVVTNLGSLSSFLYTVDVGAALEWSVDAVTTVTVDLRYSYGLSDVEATPALYRIRDFYALLGAKFTL